jgi:hypothetical protein
VYSNVVASHEERDVELESWTAWKLESALARRPGSGHGDPVDAGLGREFLCLGPPDDGVKPVLIVGCVGYGADEAVRLQDRVFAPHRITLPLLPGRLRVARTPVDDSVIVRVLHVNLSPAASAIND